MKCKKCGGEMKVINSTSQKYYNRVIYGCCGEIQVRNEEKPETAQKYNLPSIDEIQQRRSEEIKKLNSKLEPKQYQELSAIEAGEQPTQAPKKKFSCPDQSCDNCSFKCNEQN